LKRQVPFFLHDLGALELDSVAEVLRGPILTTGDTVASFERRFAEFLGRGHAVGVTSCTGAMHLALVALGIGPGDEVITTPMTFVATATAILQAGATPRFVDVDPETGNLDVGRIEAAVNPRTRAVLPVHLFGLMCDMRSLRRVADRHGLRIVEDAAHCVDGERDGVRPGELADAACFSFYATKELTCGEGGAIVTDDEELARKLRLLRLHGITKTAADRHREGWREWDMPLFGWKYNMDNIQAALLVPQLERIPEKRSRRQILAARYRRHLQVIPDVRLPAIPDGARHAWHLFTLRVGAERRNDLITALGADGIAATVNYRAVHLLEYFASALRHRCGDFPVAETIGAETLSLPFYPTMPDEDVDYVSERIDVHLRRWQER
jgi:dTDP-4-amino-4,6-dideoxygalactose transaminase